MHKLEIGEGERKVENGHEGKGERIASGESKSVLLICCCSAQDQICTQTATAQVGFDPGGPRPYEEESFLTGPNSMHNPNSRL